MPDHSSDAPEFLRRLDVRWPRRRFGVLLRTAREQAKIGQRQIAQWLRQPGTKSPYDQSWVSRQETGSALPPHPVTEAWIFKRLLEAPLPLPASAVLAAHIELVVHSVHQVVDVRSPFSGYLRDLVSQHLPDSNAPRLLAAHALPYPCLFEILAAGQGRINAVSRVMRHAGVHDWVDPLTVDLGRMGAKTWAAEVVDQLQAVTDGGLSLPEIEAWPHKAAYADLADAIIHVRARVQLRIRGALVQAHFTSHSAD